MSEYKVKLKLSLPRLLPPYSIEGIEIYEANSGKEALEMAKVQYLKAAMIEGIDVDEYPLQIKEIEKL